MSKKTVEFMRLELIDSDGNRIDHDKLENIWHNIFNKYCVDNGSYRSLDLSPQIAPEDIEPKKILDLFEHEEEPYLFGRICKKKSKNAMLRRDYETLKATEVFNNKDSLKQGIEGFTFFIIDFGKGILTIANTKDAPGASVLNNIFDNYNQEYTLKFTNIPNEDGVNALYGSQNPTVSKLRFEIPTPNAEFLLKVLQLEEPVILEMAKNKDLIADIVIKAAPYKKLETGQSAVRRIIDILKKKKDNYGKAVITGKSEDFSTTDFDLHARYFSYPIDVKNYRQKNGKKIELDLGEITEQYKNGLFEAYHINYKMILAIADRMD